MNADNNKPVTDKVNEVLTIDEVSNDIDVDCEGDETTSASTKRGSRFLTALTLGGVMALAACAPGPSATMGDRGPAVNPVADQSDENLVEEWAQNAYDNYEDATNGAAAFNAVVIESGNVSDIAGISVGELLAPPDVMLVGTVQGTEISDLSFIPRPEGDEYRGRLDLSELEYIGRSLDDATYQVIDVELTVAGNGTVAYQSLVIRFDDDTALILDPVVEEAEGYARDRSRLLMEGWGLMTDIGQEIEGYEEGDPAAPPSGARCRLVSTNATNKTQSWPAYYVYGYNMWGSVIFRMDIAAETAAIACTGSTSTTCGATGSQTSTVSRIGISNFLYNTDCDYHGATSTSGAYAQAYADTGCAYRSVVSGSADINYSLGGSGVYVTLNWGGTGSRYVNGGSYTDSCYWGS